MLEAIEAACKEGNGLQTANEEGEAVFEWWSGAKKLIVRLHADGARAVMRQRVGGREERGIATAEEFAAVYRWLRESSPLCPSQKQASGG